MKSGINMPAILLSAILFVTGMSWHQQTHNTYAIDKSVKHLDVKQLHCMAKNIYWESSGEPKIGQIAVARVVMNRVAYGYASDPCRVIYQTTVIETDLETKRVCQFSWVCAGKEQININNPKYQQALQIAKKVLTEDAWNDIIPSNILFFHSSRVNPGWKYNPVIVIGNHIFYSKT